MRECLRRWAARFVLPCVTATESAERRAYFLSERRRRQPAAPSLGSVFTGEAGAAGIYADAAGLKGVRAGGAEISPVHANFIVNAGGATTGDFLGLAAYAAERLGELFGVSPEKEFEILQDDLPF